MLAFAGWPGKFRLVFSRTLTIALFAGLLAALAVAACGGKLRLDAGRQALPAEARPACRWLANAGAAGKLRTHYVRQRDV